MKETEKGWKSGVGVELLTVVIVMLALLVFDGIIELAGSYDATIQSQVIADIINDGAVSYALNDMNVSEIAYKKMAQKIYEANRDLMSQSGWCTLGSWGDSNWTFGLAADNLNLFSPAEQSVVQSRGEIKQGVLDTVSFDFNKSGHVDKSATEIRNKYDDKIYGVKYYGPKYMDQVITAQISSFFTIPIIRKEITRTSKSVVFTTANDPYNGRADEKGETAFYNNRLELEDIAYKSVEVSEAAANSQNIPAYGSIQQKILLEARRHLGSGYSLSSRGPWPVVDWLGKSNESYDKGENSYYHCYSFVNACFEKFGGLVAATGTYSHISLSRNVQYTNLIKTKDIWDEMQTKTEYIDKQITNARRHIWYLKVPASIRRKYLHTSKPYRRSGNTWYYIRQYKGQYMEMRITDPDIIGVELVNGRRMFVKEKPGLTYAEAMAKYCGADRVKKFALASAQTWTKDKLQPGDVLIFSDPNWRPRMASMIRELDKLETPNESVFAKYDKPSQISHYAIYIGNGRMVHSANKSVPSASVGDQGVFVTDVSGLEKKKESTQMITGVLRFNENAGMPEVELINPHE